MGDMLHKSHVEAELQERSLGTQGSLPVESVSPYRKVDEGGERTEHEIHPTRRGSQQIFLA